MSKAQKFESVVERTELPANGRLIIFNKGMLKENGTETEAPTGTLVIGTLEGVKIGEKFKNKTYSIRAQGMSDLEDGLTGVEDGTLVLIDAPPSLVKQMNNVNVGDLILVDYGGKGILKSGDYAGNMFYKFDVKRAVDGE
jgi:hypothetical protein